MRTGLQELDAQLGQNAAAFSGMGNSAQAAVQALLQYISQVNQAASAEMQALAVRRQTTAATEEQASAGGDCCAGGFTDGRCAETGIGR